MADTRSAFAQVLPRASAPWGACTHACNAIERSSGLELTEVVACIELVAAVRHVEAAAVELVQEGHVEVA